MAKPDAAEAKALAMLAAFADEGEPVDVCLKRIIRDRDEQLRLRADGPAIVKAVEQASGAAMPTEARPGLDVCPKHGRAFRSPQQCNECRAEELDARGAAALQINNAQRSAAEPEKAS